jgi:carboxyl-terminal processing protease
LKSFLDGEKCKSSETRFIGCIQALNVLGAYAKPGLAIAAGDMALADPTRYGKTISTLGPLTIVEALTPAKSEDSVMKAWMRIKAHKDLQIYSFSQVVKEGKAARVDFHLLIDTLAKSIPNDGTEGLIASEAVNTYYASAVDPHTHINPTQELMDQSESTGKSFFGIGMLLKAVSGKGIQVAPIEDTPAQLAGIRNGDLLIAVDGKTIAGMEKDQVVDLIRGTKGTPVVLTILRKEKTLLVTVVRDQIVIKNVVSRMLEDRGIKYGYIRLGSFMEGTACQQIHESIVQLTKDGAKALILDLRDNGGGRLDQAGCISSLFLGPAKVFAQLKDLDSEKLEPLVGPANPSTKLPMVTLIDAGSASASEILSGALQDYGRSWIAGSRSFGKATVQSPTEWQIGGSEIAGVTIYRTIQRFYQPSGRTNQVMGIEPDFRLDPKPGATDEDRFELHESDLYNNYLPAIGKPWKQPRAGTVKKVGKCMTDTGIAAKLYASRLGDAMLPDYQLLAAEDLLTCAVK